MRKRQTKKRNSETKLNYSDLVELNGKGFGRYLFR